MRLGAPAATVAGGREGSRCEATPSAAREAYSLYVERCGRGHQRSRWALLGPRLLDGNEDAMTQLAVEGLREMALAPDVFHQDDLAGADAARLPVARGDLHPRVQVDDVLPSRRRVPVEIIVRLDLPADDPGRGQARRESARAAGLDVRDLHVLEVGLALLIDEQMMDLHGRSCL